MPNPIYILYIRYFLFGLVGFYGTSIIVGYLMPNPIYRYLLDIYDLVFVGSYGISTIVLFNAKSFLFTYIKYMISKHILLIIFLNASEHFSFSYN